MWELCLVVTPNIALELLLSQLGGYSAVLDNQPHSTENEPDTVALEACGSAYWAIFLVFNPITGFAVSFLGVYASVSHKSCNNTVWL